MNEQLLKNLPCFVQVAKLGSFSAAARAMNITPAAVSKNVSILENLLKVRLFNRTTRNLNLTQEGFRLLQEADSAITLLENVFDHLKFQPDSPMGTVRISVANVVGKHLVLPLLPELHQRYPNIQYDLDFEDRLVDVVKEGYDLVIRGAKVADSSLILRPLMPLDIRLAASPEYLNLYGEPKTLDELNQHRHIFRRFANGQIVPWRFRCADGSFKLYYPSNQLLTVSDPEAVMIALLNNMGIGEVPNYLLEPALKAGRLKIILPKLHDKSEYQLVMLYPHKSLISERVKCVIDFFVEKFAKYRSFLK